MLLTVDRIEEGFAILVGEDTSYSLALQDISFEINEGDILECELTDSNIKVISISQSEKKEAVSRIESLLDRLRKKSKR